MSDWWDLGEWSGYSGNIHHYVTCAFCGESGHLVVAHHMEKKHAQRAKTLNYDTCRCENCGNLTFVFWARGHGLADFRSVPWPKTINKHPDYWPSQVGRYWLQAKRSLSSENYDAALLTARSALQAALRNAEAKGDTLFKEIDDLSSRGLLPPIMREWSHAIRLMGNDSAHPAPGDEPPNPADVVELVRFLDFLFEYLYDLPHRIQQFRDKA